MARLLFRPKVKLKLNKKQLEALEEKLREAKDAYVTVGVHDDAGAYPDGTSVVDVALFNEFGTKDIPERSFMRSAVIGNMDKINAWRVVAMRNMVFKDWSAEQALEMIGLRIQVLIQNRIKSNIPPENAASTQAQKKRDGVGQRTLINTGLLLRSVQYRVATGKDP